MNLHTPYFTLIFDLNMFTSSVTREHYKKRGSVVLKVSEICWSPVSSTNKLQRWEINTICHKKAVWYLYTEELLLLSRRSHLCSYRYPRSLHIICLIISSINMTVVNQLITFQFFFSLFDKAAESRLKWCNSMQTWNLRNKPEGFVVAVGLGGLGVTCLPRDPRFAVSNPVEVDGFFQEVKTLSTGPPIGTLGWRSRVDFRLVKEPQAWKNKPLSKI